MIDKLSNLINMFEIGESMPITEDLQKRPSDVSDEKSLKSPKLKDFQVSLNS